MNIVFAGIYPFSEPHLLRLLAADQHHVKYLLTSETRPILSKAFAQKFGFSGSLTVLESQDQLLETLRGDGDFSSSAWLVTAGFPEKISTVVIGAFGGRTLNVHPSLLPRHRGPDPIRRAILAGEKVFGFSVHSLTDRFDVGSIYLQWGANFAEDLITEELVRQLANESSEALAKLLGDEAPTISAPVEDIDWTLFPYEQAVAPSEFEIRQSDGLEELSRKIRAAGLSQTLNLRFANGAVYEIPRPQDTFTEYSVLVPGLQNHIEVCWKPGGAVSVEYK